MWSNPDGWTVTENHGGNEGWTVSSPDGEVEGFWPKGGDGWDMSKGGTDKLEGFKPDPKWWNKAL
jgi:hypothetical protein